MNKSHFVRVTCYFLLVLMTLSFGFFLPVLFSSSLGIAVIIFLTRSLLGKDFANFLLFPRTRGDWRNFLLFFFCGSFLFAINITLLKIFHAHYDWHAASTLWLIFLVVPIQSLYEEVVFRSVVQRQLLSKWVPHDFLRALLLAFVFSLSHWLNYRLTAGVSLQLSALLGLFTLGLSGGLIFNYQKNLSGTWGFHAGWNTLRFGCVHSDGGVPLPEAVTFHQIEGSWSGLALAFFVLLFVVVQTHRERAQNRATKANL